jgi:hypothetical protein
MAAEIAVAVEKAARAAKAANGLLPGLIAAYKRSQLLDSLCQSWRLAQAVNN